MIDNAWKTVVHATARLLLAAALALPGCRWFSHSSDVTAIMNVEEYKHVSTRIDYPDVESENYAEMISSHEPITLASHQQAEFWELSLEEATKIALTNSAVLRDLGGLVLQSPESVRTVYTPAIQETDPRFGVESALSAFDAHWSTQAFFEKNDRALNNQFFGGGTRLFEQDLFNYQSQLTKRAATGGEFTVRHLADYDFNNAPANRFTNGAWTTFLEAEFRQPILQGAGVDFNRIAGPGAVPGVYNGVMIARINTDVSLADFEIGVRNLINDVETSYWELYYAYRDLDAKIAARNQALETWRKIRAAYETGRRGGEAENEARAREQYFRVEEEVQNALSGFAQESVRATTFRGLGGVYNNERKLRLLMGVPISDGRLIRPSQEPTMTKILFTWDEIAVEALMRRPELRRQKWFVKRRELECVAARNHLYPRFDTVGRYRWRGFGHHLLDSSGRRPPFDNAVEDLTGGNFQEWQLGFEMSFPVGYRQAHVAVRNAQLNLVREKAVLSEQEREVIHDLSNAIAELDRAYMVAKTNYNRRLAAKQQLAALEAVYEDADENERTRRLVDLLLDAQRRLADAESSYYRSLVEYMLAVKQVHYNKGSLLDYNEVHLSEGPWPNKAYGDAAKRDRLRMKGWELNNFILHQPPVVTPGSYAQQAGVSASLDVSPEHLPHGEQMNEAPPPAEVGTGIGDGQLRSEQPNSHEVPQPAPPRAPTNGAAPAPVNAAEGQTAASNSKFDPSVRQASFVAPPARNDGIQQPATPPLTNAATPAAFNTGLIQFVPPAEQQQQQSHAPTTNRVDFFPSP